MKKNKTHKNKDYLKLKILIIALVLIFILIPIKETKQETYNETYYINQTNFTIETSNLPLLNQNVECYNKTPKITTKKSLTWSPSTGNPIVSCEVQNLDDENYFFEYRLITDNQMTIPYGIKEIKPYETIKILQNIPISQKADEQNYKCEITPIIEKICELNKINNTVTVASLNENEYLNVPVQIQKERQIVNWKPLSKYLGFSIYGNLFQKITEDNKSIKITEVNISQNFTEINYNEIHSKFNNIITAIEQKNKTVCEKVTPYKVEYRSKAQDNLHYVDITCIIENLYNETLEFTYWFEYDYNEKTDEKKISIEPNRKEKITKSVKYDVEGYDCDSLIADGWVITSGKSLCGEQDHIASCIVKPILKEQCSDKIIDVLVNNTKTTDIISFEKIERNINKNITQIIIN